MKYGAGPSGRPKPEGCFDCYCQHASTPLKVMRGRVQGAGCRVQGAGGASLNGEEGRAVEEAVVFGLRCCQPCLGVDGQHPARLHTENTRRQAALTCQGCGVWGVECMVRNQGCRVWGSGSAASWGRLSTPRSSVWGSGFRVWGPGCGVLGFGFWILGYWCRISDFWFRVSDSGFRNSGVGFRVSGFGFQVSGFRFWVSGLGAWCLELGVLGLRFRVSGQTSPSRKAFKLSEKSPSCLL